MNWFSYLVLIRPANILTAVSDILAGLAIAGGLSAFPYPVDTGQSIFLILSTVGLYAGGIVFNDIFDYELDRIERPERVLPSGKISLQEAKIFGSLLLTGGIFCAALAGSASALVAISIAFCALVYDKYGKHHPVAGPLNMGLCRGLNLLLGMSLVSLAALGNLVFLALLPVIFIAAVTLTSRGEVQGNNRRSIILALILDLVIAMVIIILGVNKILHLPVVIPFVALWLLMNTYAKVRAILQNQPKTIMLAVKTGVISLIVLNASYVAGFGDWKYALMVLLLLPLALFLSRKFSVT